MLTTADLKSIGTLMDEKFDKFEVRFETKIDKKFDDFAIIVKNSLDSKPDREEVEDRFNRLEHKIDLFSFTVNQNHDRRLEMLEDTMRQVKTRLQM